MKVIGYSLQIWNLKYEGKEYKKELNYKWNRGSVTNQIAHIINWGESRDFEELAKNNLKKSFWIYLPHATEDENSLKPRDVFFEVLSCQIYKLSLKNKPLNQELLRLHTDKIWMFEYLYQIYSSGNRMIRYTHWKNNLQEATESIVAEMQNRNKMVLSQSPHHNTIAETDIINLREILLKEKRYSREIITPENQIVRNIIKNVDRLDMDSRYWEFEQMVVSTWNADYYSYFDKTPDMFDSLVFLYWAMDKSERESIHLQYDWVTFFDKIKNDYKDTYLDKLPKQLLLFWYTENDNRNARIRILQEQIADKVIMPESLWEEEYWDLETIVYAKNSTRLPLLYTKTQYATAENRKKTRQHKQTTRRAFLQELLSQELSNRSEFPRSIKNLQKHIMRKDDTPLYKAFPLIPTSSPPASYPTNS
jgi:hypothetical protein